MNTPLVNKILDARQLSTQNPLVYSGQEDQYLKASKSQSDKSLQQITSSHKSQQQKDIQTASKELEPQKKHITDSSEGKQLQCDQNDQHNDHDKDSHHKIIVSQLSQLSKQKKSSCPSEQLIEEKGRSNPIIIDNVSAQRVKQCSTPTFQRVKENLKEFDDQKQMMLDLMALKMSVNKKRVSQERHQDIRLNKTMINNKYQKRSVQNQQSSILLDEKRMIIKMAISKKQQNYTKLKEWDRKREQQLALHQNIIFNLQNQVNKRIKSSLQNFQIYQAFFREKARQQQKYCTFPVLNTRKALQNNNLSRSVFINCSIILNSLSDENVEKCKKVADFVLLIKKSILKQLMEQHLQQTHKELMEIREKISTLKSTLNKCNQETSQKTKQLGAFFNEQSIKVQLQPEADFFLVQLSFLSKADQQLTVQKKLGEYCLEHYQIAIQEELKRSATIRQAMLTYSKGLKETYNIDLQDQEVEQLSKGEQAKLINQLYAFEELFEERNLTVLRKHLKIPNQQDINVSHFNKYIMGFEYQQFDCRTLFLKQFHIYYITFNLQQENCLLVISADGFLHMFINKTNSHIYAKPDISLKITEKTLQYKELSDNRLELIKKSQRKTSMISYFWESKSEPVYKIRFNKTDSRQEFIDYLKKLSL